MTEEAEGSGQVTGGERKYIKVTAVGDSGVGKTCLLMTFANNKFPDEGIDRESLFQNSQGTIRGSSSFEVPVSMETGGETIELGLTDTIGTENYRGMRELFAAKSDIFLVCFSVTDPESLENVKRSWLTEIRLLSPKAPFLLVGTKTDLREDADVVKKMKENGAEPLTLLQGIKLAKTLGAKEYVECSSLNMVSVKSVFGTVVLVIDQEQGNNKPSKRKSGTQSCLIS